MFGISFFEMLIIAVVALIFIGPERLPELAQQIGKLVRTYRNARWDLKNRLFDAAQNDLKIKKPAEENQLNPQAKNHPEPNAKSEAAE